MWGSEVALAPHTSHGHGCDRGLDHDLAGAGKGGDGAVVRLTGAQDAGAVGVDGRGGFSGEGQDARLLLTGDAAGAAGVEAVARAGALLAVGEADARALDVAGATLAHRHALIRRHRHRMAGRAHETHRGEPDSDHMRSHVRRPSAVKTIPVLGLPEGAMGGWVHR